MSKPTYEYDGGLLYNELMEEIISIRNMTARVERSSRRAMEIVADMMTVEPAELPTHVNLDADPPRKEEQKKPTRAIQDFIREEEEANG